MTAEYLKIRSGSRKVFVRVKDRCGPRMFGMRVNRDGSDWERETADSIEINMIVFGEADIIGRYRMNFHYAELEPES